MMPRGRCLLMRCVITVHTVCSVRGGSTVARHGKGTATHKDRPLGKHRGSRRCNAPASAVLFINGPVSGGESLHHFSNTLAVHGEAHHLSLTNVSLWNKGRE